MDGKKSYPKLSSRVNKKPIVVRVNYPKDFLGDLESMLLVGMINMYSKESEGGNFSSLEHYFLM